MLGVESVVLGIRRVREALLLGKAYLELYEWICSKADIPRSDPRLGLPIIRFLSLLAQMTAFDGAHTTLNEKLCISF